MVTFGLAPTVYTITMQPTAFFASKFDAMQFSKRLTTVCAQGLCFPLKSAKGGACSMENLFALIVINCVEPSVFAQVNFHLYWRKIV